ncbi:MAG: GNAT family N-acetyltransferase, partial [Pseudomonadota bacterium]|nr:GNAT family N-acetyltransferase [Pseudomonadota bacterium]
MPRSSQPIIEFVRLPDIPLEELVAHMSDPRVGTHMPLLTFSWDLEMAAKFVATKEACWLRDGL